MRSSGDDNGCVIVGIDTNLNTRLLTRVPRNATIRDFRESIKTKHTVLFPDEGDVNVSIVEAEFHDRLYRADDILRIGDLFKGPDGLLYVELTKSLSVATIPSDLPRVSNNVAERESLPGHEQQAAQVSKMALGCAANDALVKGDISDPVLEQPDNAYSPKNGFHGSDLGESKLGNKRKLLHEQVNMNSTVNCEAVDLAALKEVIVMTGLVSPSTHEIHTGDVFLSKKRKLEEDMNLAEKNLVAGLAGAEELLEVVAKSNVVSGLNITNEVHGVLTRFPVEDVLLENSLARKASHNSNSSDDSSSGSGSGLQTTFSKKSVDVRQPSTNNGNPMVAEVASNRLLGKNPSLKKESVSQEIERTVREEHDIQASQTCARENMVKSFPDATLPDDSSSTDDSSGSQSGSQKKQRGTKNERSEATLSLKKVVLVSVQEHGVPLADNSLRVLEKLPKKQDIQISEHAKKDVTLRSSHNSDHSDDPSGSKSQRIKLNVPEKLGMADGQNTQNEGSTSASTSEDSGINDTERSQKHMDSPVHSHGNGGKSCSSDSGNSDDSRMSSRELSDTIRHIVSNVETNHKDSSEPHRSKGNSDEINLDQDRPNSNRLPATLESGSDTEESSSDGNEEELPKVSRRQMGSIPDNNCEVGRSNRRTMRGSSAVDLKYKHLIDSQDGFDELISLSQQKLNFSSGNPEEVQPCSDPHECVARVPLADDSLSIDLVPDTQGGDLNENLGSQDLQNNLAGSKVPDDKCGENISMEDRNANRFVVKEEPFPVEPLRNTGDDKFSKLISQPLNTSKNSEIGDIPLKLETVSTDQNMSGRRHGIGEEPSQAKSEDSQQIRAAVQLTRMSMSIEVEAGLPDSSPSLKRKKKRRQEVSSGEEHLLMNFQESMGELGEKEKFKQIREPDEITKHAGSPLRSISVGRQLEFGSKGPETVDEHQPSGGDVIVPQNFATQDIENDECRALMPSGQLLNLSTDQNNSTLETPTRSLRKRKGVLKKHGALENKDQQVLARETVETKDTLVEISCADIENTASLLTEGNVQNSSEFKKHQDHLTNHETTMNGRRKRKPKKDLEGDLVIPAVEDLSVGMGKEVVETVRSSENAEPGHVRPGLLTVDTEDFRDSGAISPEENHEVLAKESERKRKGKKSKIAVDFVEEVPEERLCTAAEESQMRFPAVSLNEKSKGRQTPKSSKKARKQEGWEGRHDDGRQTLVEDGAHVLQEEPDTAFLPRVSSEVDKVRADTDSMNDQHHVITTMEGNEIPSTIREDRKKKKKKKSVEFISPEKSSMLEETGELEEPAGLETAQEHGDNLKTAGESRLQLSVKKSKKKKQQEVSALEDGSGDHSKVDSMNGQIGQDDEILPTTPDDIVKEKREKHKKKKKVVHEEDLLLWSDLGQEVPSSGGTAERKSSRRGLVCNT